MSNPFYQKDILSIKDFSKSDLSLLFSTVNKIESLEFEERTKICRGKVLANLFYEGSTRTKLSFETAMLHIGGNIIGFQDTKGTAIDKGETLSDTIKVVDGYSDAIILRHPTEGAARFAAEIAEKPLINGGSGSEEHPTQAMVDLYTIIAEKKEIDGLNIALVGDLKYGRTVYSLLYGLAKYSPNIFLVAPPQLKIRNEIHNDLDNKIKMVEIDDVESIIDKLDVMYVTRIQKERVPDPAEYEKVKGSYIIDNKLVENAKDSLMILHPLPRVGEIKSEIDNTKYAKYFEQAHNGKKLRASLLSLMLNEETI